MSVSSALVTLTDANFEAEVLSFDGTILVDFTATWCAPCHAMVSILEAVADELEGRVKFGALDVDHNPAIKTRYGIRAVPTVMVFKGGQCHGLHVGVVQRERIVKLLNLEHSP